MASTPELVTKCKEKHDNATSRAVSYYEYHITPYNTTTERALLTSRVMYSVDGHVRTVQEQRGLRFLFEAQGTHRQFDLGAALLGLVVGYRILILVDALLDFILGKRPLTLSERDAGSQVV
jgi:hypothetical protein